ncbi:acyl-coenzyme A synthetase ACSM4, mitochondrial-like [Oculina patagonica]
MADVLIRGTKDFQVPEYFNFADIIDEWAQKEKEGKRKSDIPALWWIDGAGNELKWSFQDVALNSKKTANVLCTAADIKSGDRVMVILPTIPEYWLIQAACLRTGGVLLITPVNIGPKELHRRILKSKPVCVVAAPCDQVKSELLDVVDQITSSGEVNMRSKLLVNRMRQEQREGWLSFKDLFKEASADHQSVKSLSSAPIQINHTSGTTGNAKMAEHTQTSKGLFAVMRKARFVETDLIWSATPTGWAVLLNVSFFGAWSAGSGAFAHYKYVTAREALDTLQKYPITHGIFRPSIYMEALNEGNLKSLRFPKLKICLVTGESANKDMILRWKEETGVELLNAYGQTETHVLATRKPGDHCCPDSVGKALPGTDLLIVDDNYQEVPPGTLGRVVVRVKPYCPVRFFTRYVDEPEKTAACFCGDFYVTGDLGRMDAEGYFWIAGRADDMIFYNSLNINPYEVENCLKEHPAVLDCAVCSSPYMMGQTIKAFIVLSSGFKNKNQDELITELQDHVTYNTGKWMCPKKMEFIEELPKTSVGKVDRRELKNKEWSKE